MDRLVRFYIQVMVFRKYLALAERHLSSRPGAFGSVPANMFSDGGKWMHEQMQIIRSRRWKLDEKISFSFFGSLKYILSTLFFLAMIIMSIKVSLYLLPLAIIAFYLAEVHFLFLFPLLIDGSPSPVISSFRLTYKAGIIRSLINVIPIAFFMLIGILNFREPFRNWYTGCMAILFWYEDEVGDRE